MFSIEFSKHAKQFLKKLDKSNAKRIFEKVKLLEENPVPHDSKRVVNSNRTFRLRIGDYRVLYETLWKEKSILIAKIDKRDAAYDKKR